MKSGRFISRKTTVFQSVRWRAVLLEREIVPATHQKYLTYLHSFCSGSVAEWLESRESDLQSPGRGFESQQPRGDCTLSKFFKQISL